MLSQDVQYLWVYEFDGAGRCLAAAWNEAPQWCALGSYGVEPDLDMGIPVLRRTDHGLAQYYRFESVISRERYDQRRAA